MRITQPPYSVVSPALSPRHSPPRALRPAEPLPNLRLGMQLPQHALLRDLPRALDLELLLHLDAARRRRGLDDGALHERVQHAGADGAAASGGGVGVEKEDGGLLGAGVGVGVAEEGEAGLGVGDCGCEVGDGGWGGGGGDELDALGLGVDFLSGVVRIFFSRGLYSQMS